MGDFPMATCGLGAGLEASASPSSQVGISAVKQRVCRVSVCSHPFILPLMGTSDKKRDVGAGAQQCTLALASAAGLCAEQAADPKSLLMALGVVGHMQQGLSSPTTPFTKQNKRVGEDLGGLGRKNSCPGPEAALG